MKKLILVTIYCCFFASAIIPQNYKESGYPGITNFSPKEYGANQQIWTITQDERGIIYFGNQKGLLEFDGYEWRIYPVPNKSVVRSLAVGEKGKLYAGAQGDLGYFFPDSLGRLTFHSLLKFIPKNNRDFSDVWNTFVSNGRVYFNVSKYIFIWNIQKEEFDIVKGTGAFHIMFMVNGTIYVREFGKGLEILKDNKLKLLKGGEKFADERVYVMLPFPGEEGTILIVTRTIGLFKYSDNKFIPFKTEADKFIKENLIYFPGSRLSDGNTLLGTVNGGALVIDNAGKVVAIYNTGSGIVSNTIYFTFQDRSGAIWLGTGEGISRIDYESPVSYYDSRNNFSARPNDFIKYNGIIYTATNNGVYYLDPLTSDFHLLKNSNNQSFVFLKSGKELLVGTFDGLFKVDRIRLSAIRETKGNEYIVHVLKHSKLNKKRIFVGAYGLWSIRKSGNGWIDEGQILDITDAVISIVQENDGRLWIGTNASGVFRITFRKDENGNSILSKPVIEHFDKSNGLQNSQVWIDNFNRKTYFSSADSIYKFDDRRKIFYSDTSDKVISAFYNQTDHQSVAVFQQDSSGRLWLGSESTLAMGIPQTDGSYKWVKAPFQRIADEQISKVYVENENIVWFLAATSVLRYDFAKNNLNRTDYPALVRRVVIGSDSTIFFGGRLSKPITLKISFKYNSIKFNFTATSYEGKNSNRFKTFLKGFDEGWSSWSNENTKEYTNLPPGRYTFNVAAENILGIKSSRGTYSFEILPPWYRTWWAYGFYVILFGLGVFAVDRIQRRRLIAKENEKLRIREVEHRAETAELQRKAAEAQSKLIQAENERKTKELEEARNLQLSMLPKEIPHLPNLDIAVYMQTATEVGGDYYDFYTGADGVLTIALGDATGHGLKAGTMVTAAKSLFSSYGKNEDIVETFHEMSSSIKSMNFPLLTMCMIIMKIKDHIMSLSSAGMPPVMIYRKSQKKVEEIIINGMPLGAVKKFPYRNIDVKLESGDLILMMSDGFPEIQNENEELLGYDRVKEYLSNADGKTPEDVIEMLKKYGNDWRNGSEITDDITFITMRIR